MKRRRRSEGGNAAVEFGLVAPMLVLLLVGMVEAGVQFGTGLLLDSAARDASRFGVTGATAPAGMQNPPSDRTATIRRIVLERGAGMFRDDRLSMTITSFGSFAAIDDPQAGTAGPGARGEVVLYELRYTQPVLTPLPQAALGASAFLHVATAIVRNEPFPAQ
jgi:Flp pilus assembly pilin Flp